MIEATPLSVRFTNRLQDRLAAQHILYRQGTMTKVDKGVALFLFGFGLCLFWATGIAVLAPPARAEHDLDSLTQRVLRRADADEIDESELTLIPGTGVSLLPPAGFVLSDQFSGLVNPDNLSSILIIELPPEAHSTLASAFSSTPGDITTAFASRGTMIEVERVSTVSIEDAQVPLVIGTQTAGQPASRKILHIAWRRKNNTTLFQRV